MAREGSRNFQVDRFKCRREMWSGSLKRGSTKSVGGEFKVVLVNAPLFKPSILAGSS